MEIIKELIDILVHLDVHLQQLIIQYGTLTYLILFLVIFAETGFVVTPFLPGDSLIFAAGTFAANGAFNIHFLFILLVVAAILGDTINYWIGNYLGPRIAGSENIRFINKSHIERTHKFFEKYGGKTIIIARFVPIVRTFAPFVAGIGSMTYKKFISYNVIGGILWVGLFSYGGYFFGNIEFVKNNFSLVILAIIIISIMPPVVEYVRHKMSQRK
ncbi:MAG TPA: DedA family protein [Ignavibacteriaceae bacterium]|nr:DedA family protein [Ignavibacteriaceae bacterium]